MAGPATPAFLGAAATVAGGVFSDRQSTRDHKRQLAHNAYWNSNKYQHTVRDLKAAGLNPALAYRQGASAQTSASAPQRENIGAKAITAAKEVALLSAQKKNIDADTLLKQNQSATEAKNLEQVVSKTEYNRSQIKYLTEKAQDMAYNNDFIKWINANNTTGIPVSRHNLDQLIKSSNVIAQLVAGALSIFGGGPNAAPRGNAAGKQNRNQINKLLNR